MNKRIAAIVIGTVIVTAAAAGALALRKPHVDLAKKYDFVPVQRMDLSERIDATGNVLSLQKKDLYPDFDGAVERINVKAGDHVKKGDILITLSSSTLQDQWEEANSAVKQAKLNLDVANGQLATELAVNHVSTSNALQLENYYHQVALAKEQLKQAQQRLDSLNAKNDGYYVANNEELFIRAPFDGQVAWINVTKGDRVTPQTLLATVADPNQLGVEAQIDQNDVSVVRAGLPATVTGKDPQHSENSGVVTAVSTVGHNDQTSASANQTVATTTGVIDFPIQIKLNAAAKGLQPGMSVDVTVVADQHPDALAIPAAAVVQRNGQDFVNVKKGDKVAPVAVELGFQHGKYWEVKSGLEAGDKVAVLKPTFAAGPSTAQGSTPKTGGGMALGGRVRG